MTIKTNPDGSSIPIYLSQSAVGRPFQTGRIQTLPNGDLFGYSGLINYDVAAAATYPMLDFQLENTAFFQMFFSLNYKVMLSSGRTYGYLINIDGTDTIKYTNDVSSGGRMDGVILTNFIIPANKQTLISLLNPDAGTDLLEANITLIGKQI